MCGVIAYTGPRQAYPVLMKGLQRVEYRGYDSAGIALLNGGLIVHKKTGKVAELLAATSHYSSQAQTGIGHTRWATHGGVTDDNAHPHLSASGRLAIIHNGIIENYHDLKQSLLEKGYVFKGQTDTEVLINFIEETQKERECSLEEAIRISLQEVVGAYAIVVIDQSQPNQLIGARQGSPMVVGIGEGEFFIASDVTPIVEYTDQAIFLNDNEMVVIRDNEYQITTLGGKSVSPVIQKLNVSLESIEKGDFEHFMLKEIYEQPKAIATLFNQYFNAKEESFKFENLDPYTSQISKARRIVIVACGTARFAGMVAKSYIEQFARIPVEVAYASEYRYSNPVIQENDIVMGVSHSGETIDTLLALEKAKKEGALVLGICNVVGSSIAREVHGVIYTHAGPEIGVASTKAFTAQLTTLVLLALWMGEQRGKLDPELRQGIVSELKTLPLKIQQALACEPVIKEIAHAFSTIENFLFIGRGYNFPLALEGALKLKEISYVHAEGYPAGELKHGVLALVDEKMPVLCIAPQDGQYHKVLSNIEEIKARDGQVVSIVTSNDQRVQALSDYVISLPPTHEALFPVIAAIPLQLFAYQMGLIRGCNVDQPRNLAKAVTVE